MGLIDWLLPVESSLKESMTADKERHALKAALTTRVKATPAVDKVKTQEYRVHVRVWPSLRPTATGSKQGLEGNSLWKPQASSSM